MKTISLTILFFLTITVSAFSSNGDINTIKKYYSLLSNKETLAGAYSISAKKVDYDTFYSWYKYNIKTIVDKITQNEDGSYSFYVTVINEDPDDPYDIECAVYNVKMIVGKGRILKSESIQVYDYVYYEKKIDNEATIKVMDDTRNKRFVMKLTDMNNNVLCSKNYEYFDQFRYGFRINDIIGDFVFIEISGFEFMAYDLCDIKNKRIYDTKFTEIGISKDKKVIINYANDSFFEHNQGMVLLIHDNKYLNIDVTDNGVEKPEIIKTKNEYQIRYNEYMKGDVTKLIGKKSISLSYILKK